MKRWSPCTTCGMPTRSQLGLCQDCRPAPAAPDPRPCKLCDASTTVADGYCRTCTRTLAAAQAYVPDPAHAIKTRGQWITGPGGVQVWARPVFPTSRQAPSVAALLAHRRTARPVEEPEIPECISHNTERGWQWHRETRIDWPLTRDAECGCYAAHYAHVEFVRAMNRRAADLDRGAA